MDNSKPHITFGRPFQIFTTVLVLLFAVAVVDAFIFGIVEVLTYWRYLPKRETSQLEKQELSPGELKAYHRENSLIEFMADGTIHFLYNPDFSSKKDYSGPLTRTVTKWQVYDTNDKMVWDGNTADIPYQYLGWSEDIRPYLEYNNQNYRGSISYNINREFDGGQLRNCRSFLPSLSQTLEFRLETQQGGLEFWRYDPDNDFLTGFEAMGAKIGYISASGFSDSKRDVKPFGKFGSVKNFTDKNPFTPTVLWQTDKRLYEIDFTRRHVEVIFESNQVNIESFSTRRCLPPGFSSAPYLKAFNESCRPFIDCVMKDKSHHLILMEPRSDLTIRLPQDWEKWEKGIVEITAIKDGIFLRHGWSKVKPAPPHRTINDKQMIEWRREIFKKPLERIDDICKVNEDGSLVLLNSFSCIRPPQKFSKHIPTITESARAFLREFSSPLYHIINNKFEDKISNGTRSNNGFIAITSAIIKELHPDKTIPNLVLCAAFVLAALWHGWARRTSWGKLILWLIIVGAFNLAGLLAYLALNHTPVIKCPVCGRKRGLEKDSCSQCGSPLPTPQRKPTDLIMAN
jgi:hypothetical protein